MNNEAQLKTEAVYHIITVLPVYNPVVLYTRYTLFTCKTYTFALCEIEALAAVSAVKEVYPYIYGFPFKLITDHNPVTSLKGLKDVGGRLTRWMIFLQ